MPQTRKTLGRAFSILLGVVSVAACGTPTPYQQAIEGKGYTVQQIEENRVRVSFAGNTLTKRETVENYLLFRAAETTLAHGFQHFVIVGQDTETATTYRTRRTGSSVPGYRGSYYFGSYYPYWGRS